MMAWLAAKLGSTIFKAVGVAAIVALAFVSVKYGLASIKIDHLTAENARLTDEKAKALESAAIWKATSETNRAELERLTLSLENAKRVAEAESQSLKKDRAAAEASYRKLKSEIANVAETDDRNLGPVGQRGYRGLRERHVQVAP